MVINRYLEKLTEELGDNFHIKWIYAGGRKGRHKNYFDLFNREKKLQEPELTGRCKCGHEIIENCYVYNKDINDIKVLGNCCIKKFLNESNSGRTCEDCGSPHRNRKVNYCNKCRLKYCEGCFKQKNNDYKYCYSCYEARQKSNN